MVMGRTQLPILFTDSSHDVLDLTGVAGLDTFADLQSRSTQVGADTVIDLNGTDSITLTAVDVVDLQADYFLL